MSRDAVPGSLRLRLLVAGLAGSTVGIAGLAYAVFGPTYTAMECRSAAPAGGSPIQVCETRNENLFDQGLDPIATTFLVCVGVLFGAVGVAAVLASRAWYGFARLTVVTATGLLAVGTFLSILSVGPMFLPGLLIAIWASWETLR